MNNTEKEHYSFGDLIALFMGLFFNGGWLILLIFIFFIFVLIFMDSTDEKRQKHELKLKQIELQILQYKTEEGDKTNGTNIQKPNQQ
jgi:uncharacterized membrane protein